MISLDTNVLVRYITRDDVSQTARATQLLDSLTPENPGFFTLVALAELCWVLARSYQLQKNDLLRAIDWLLEIDAVTIESELCVIEARHRFANSNTDFGDCLIASCSISAGCKSIFTFDKLAARSAGMQLLV